MSSSTEATTKKRSRRPAAAPEVLPGSTPAPSLRCTTCQQDRTLDELLFLWQRTGQDAPHTGVCRACQVVTELTITATPLPVMPATMPQADAERMIAARALLAEAGRSEAPVARERVTQARALHGMMTSPVARPILEAQIRQVEAVLPPVAPAPAANEALTWGQTHHNRYCHRWRRLPEGGWRSQCNLTLDAESAPDGDDSGQHCPVCDPASVVATATADAPADPDAAVRAALAAHAATYGAKTPERFTRPAGMRERGRAPLALLTRGRYQPRLTLDDKATEELAASIKQHGVLTDLLCFVNENGTLELIGGHRRREAAGRAGLTHVPVKILEVSPQEAHELTLIDNANREDLSYLERGRAYKLYRETWNVSDVQIAKRLGISRGELQQCVALAEAAPELQEALESGKLSWSQTRGIFLAAPGVHAAQAAAVQHAVGLISSGRKLTEKDVRGLTETALVHTSDRALDALGWMREIRMGGRLLLWSAGDRPQLYERAQVTEIVRESRRPGATPPEAAEPLNEATIKILRARGYKPILDRYAPWVGMGQGWVDRTPTTFYSPTEARAFAAGEVAAFEAVRARFAAHGWELRATTMMPEVESAQGRYRSFTNGWEGVEEWLAGVEAGTISPEKAADAPRTRVPAVSAADDAAPADTAAHIGASAAVPPAARAVDADQLAAERAAREAERAAERAAFDAERGGEIAGWVTVAPDPVLRLLVWQLVAALGSCRALGIEPHHWNKSLMQSTIREAERATLEAAAVELLLTSAWNNRDAALEPGSDPAALVNVLIGEQAA